MIQCIPNFLLVWEESPIGYRHCNKNWKVTGSNPTRQLAQIRDLTSLGGSQWNLGQNCRRRWFEWVRLSEADPSIKTQSLPWGSQIEVKKNMPFVIVVKKDVSDWYLVSWTFFFIFAFVSLKKLQFSLKSLGIWY